MTKTWIIKNAHTILTMDDTRRELNGHDILLRDGVIARLAKTFPSPIGAEIVDAQNAVVTPVWSTRIITFINRSHVLCQGGRTRCCLGGCKPSIRYGQALVQKRCAFPRCWG